MIYTIITFLVGIIFLIVRYGFQDSISAYYYSISNNYRVFYSVWLALVGVLLLNSTDVLLLELSAYSVIGVATAEAYKDNKYVNFIHFLFAYSAVIFGVLNILTINVGLGIISALVICTIKLLPIKTATLWAEIVSFILIITSTFI